MPNHILKNDGKLLQNLLAKVDELKQLNDFFAQQLDPDVAAHCHVAKVTNNRLIVLVDNSHWVIRLRFYIPDLLPLMREYPGLQQLQAICAKVRPNYQAVKPQRKPRNLVLSTTTATAVHNIADNIKDKQIEGILKRIACRFLLGKEPNK